MSSLIKRVVDASKDTDVLDARKNLIKLNNEIKIYQKQVKETVQSKYANFIPEVMNNEMYLSQGEAMIESIGTLVENLNTDGKAEVERCNEDLEQLQVSLQENVVGLRACIKIIQIDEKLKEMRMLNEFKNFSNAINVLAELKALIYTDDPIVVRLDCYETLKHNYIQESEQMMYNIKQRFDQLVEFKDKIFQNTKAVSIKISKNEDDLHETMVALVSTHYNPRPMCNFLIENVFKPMFNRQVTIKLQNDESDDVRLLVSYNLEAPQAVTRTNYQIIFRHIKKVFNCLSYMNISISENHCIFTIFAQHIKDKFLELLIGDCLSHAIPESLTEMHESKLVEHIRELNDFLNELLFVNTEDERDQRLLQYADKIGILFGRRFASTVLESAVTLMRKDLHDATKVTDGVLADCMVSKSTFALTAELEKLQQNAKEFPDKQGAEQMLVSVRTILERYVPEVTEYHDKLLVNIPQQSAFFHNNCMYLAQWIATQSTEHSIDNLSQYLMHQGAEQLASQVYRQRKTLQEYMDGMDLGTELVDELGPEPTRIIRQCLRQLEVLQNVWANILAPSVYTENMARLVNLICSEFIQKICNMEDISSTVASEFADIIELIQKKAPNLFKDPLSIHTEVKCWMKLTQMKMILGASLIEITEQWSEGKGPLTVNFKTDEVKKLIRALFQNTDRRANALATIV